MNDCEKKIIIIIIAKEELQTTDYEAVTECIEKQLNCNIYM